MAKKVEFVNLTIRIPLSLKSRIVSISELQRQDFGDTIQTLLEVGVSENRNSCLLSDIEIKTRRLDNLLSQVYPLLHKNYLHAGSNENITTKIVHFYYDLTPCFVQANKIPDKDKIIVCAREIIVYCENNFRIEYNQAKNIIFNKPRTQIVKDIFKSVGYVGLNPSTTLHQAKLINKTSIEEEEET